MSYQFCVKPVLRAFFNLFINPSLSLVPYWLLCMRSIFTPSHLRHHPAHNHPSVWPWRSLWSSVHLNSTMIQGKVSWDIHHRASSTLAMVNCLNRNYCKEITWYKLSMYHKSVSLSLQILKWVCHEACIGCTQLLFFPPPLPSHSHVKQSYFAISFFSTRLFTF